MPVAMDDSVRDYIAAITPERRPLFDRVHGLILEVYPEVAMVLAYKMPTYKVAERSLHVAVWKHGVSLYGWRDDGGFTSRHPEMSSGRGTIRLPIKGAEDIADDELVAVIRGALDP